MNKLRKFLALDWKRKKLFIQAYFLLGIMRAAILSLSFDRLSKKLEHHTNQAPQTALATGQQSQAREIGWAVTTAARFTPWSSNCLAQALTAQRMLQKNHIPGMFYLGVKKNQQQLDAHAWLKCDELILTGKAGHEKFTILSSFSWH